MFLFPYVKTTSVFVRLTGSRSRSFEIKQTASLSFPWRCYFCFGSPSTEYVAKVLSLVVFPFRNNQTVNVKIDVTNNCSYQCHCCTVFFWDLPIIWKVLWISEQQGLKNLNTIKLQNYTNTLTIISQYHNHCAFVMTCLQRQHHKNTMFWTNLRSRRRMCSMISEP